MENHTAMVRIVVPTVPPLYRYSFLEYFYFIFFAPSNLALFINSSFGHCCFFLLFFLLHSLKVFFCFSKAVKCLYCRVVDVINVAVCFFFLPLN